LITVTTLGTEFHLRNTSFSSFSIVLLISVSNIQLQLQLHSPAALAQNVIIWYPLDK